MGRKQNADARQRESAKWGFTIDDDMEEVSKILETIHLPIAQRARPIPVATRGIGVAASIEYMRMATTWDFVTINDICTIHQYYRVSLYLFYSQCVNARSTQVSHESFTISKPYYMKGEGELRFLLDPILKMPICTANILSAIGKVAVGNYEWHCFLPEPDAENLCNAEFCCLYFQPRNARTIIESLTVVENNEEFVTAFRENCPVPGMQWDLLTGALINPDEVWPQQYGPDQLSKDISCVQSLIMRVANRLPKSFIQTISKDGYGNRGSLVSMDPLEGMKIITTFTPPPTSTSDTRTRKRRGADGEPIECAVSRPRSRVTGVRVSCPASRVDVWSPLDDADKQDFFIGAGTLLGERSGSFSVNRLQVTGVTFSCLSPLTVMNHLSCIM